MNNSLNSEQQHRHAILLSFCDPMPAACAELQHLSAKQWQRLLHWMDISGLALYFLFVWRLHLWLIGVQPLV